MAANKQDPRYFKYSPFPKRQCAVTGAVDSNGAANFMSMSLNTVGFSASASVPLVITWANGFDPFPVDYAYKWTSAVSGPSGWTGFSNATHYLYIDYDPDTDTVSYGSTTVVPNDNPVAPSHGAGVHWFDTSKYKMYESVASVWTERIRVFVGKCVSNGTVVSSVISYALNGRWYSGEKTVQALNTEASYSHNIGSDKLNSYGRAICKTTEGNAVAGFTYDFIENYFTTAADHYSKGIYTTRLLLNHRRGTTATFVLATTTSPFMITSTNWRYIFITERSY